MDSGTLLSNQGGYVEGTDYFMTAAPNYTPYAYPHPLAGGTLPPPPINNLAITIAPMTAALGTGQTQTFAATVTGGTAPTIAWFWTTGVSAFQIGTGPTVNYTFPNAGTFQIYAVVTDPTAANSPLQSASATVTVTAPQLSPPPSKSVAARSIGPLALPAVIVHELWRLRERYISKEVHRKLHPLV